MLLLSNMHIVCMYVNPHHTFCADVLIWEYVCARMCVFMHEVWCRCNKKSVFHQHPPRRKINKCHNQLMKKTSSSRSWQKPQIPGHDTLCDQHQRTWSILQSRSTGRGILMKSFGEPIILIRIMLIKLCVCNF